MKKTTTIQVWREVAGNIAAIFCPKVAAEVAPLFNKHPLIAWTAIAWAAALLANMVALRKGADPGRDSPIAWARWIMGYAAGGSMIGWATGTSEWLTVVVVSALYGTLLLLRTPPLEVFTAELLGVVGAGAATSMHVFFMKSDMVQSLPLFNLVAVFAYGAACVVVIKWHLQGRKVFARLHKWLQRMRRGKVS